MKNFLKLWLKLLGVSAVIWLLIVSALGLILTAFLFHPIAGAAVGLLLGTLFIAACELL